MDVIDEKRVARRINFREAVRYELKDPAYFKGCVAYDLSETGVRLRLAEFLPLNTEVVLNLTLQSGQTIECMGRIVWISQIPFMDNYQAGVEFSNPELLFDARRQIKQLVACS